MTDPTPPPVEWIPGPRTWWIPRLVPGFVVGPILITVVLLLSRGAFDSRLGVYLGTWVAFCGILGGVLFLQLGFAGRFPSVRALGLSPWTLTVDLGLGQRTFTWEELRTVTLVRDIYRTAGAIRTETRARLRLGRELSTIWVTLPSRQTDRLGRFLRIPEVGAASTAGTS